MVPPEPPGGQGAGGAGPLALLAWWWGNPRVSVRAGTGHLWGSRKLICGGWVEDVGVEWFYLERCRPWTQTLAGEESGSRPKSYVFRLTTGCHKPV